MAVNWDLNLGTVVSIGLGFIGTLWRLHNWDVKTSVRHTENTNRFDNIETSHKEMKTEIAKLSVTQHECQERIAETREMVVRLDEANKQRSALMKNPSVN